MEKRKKILLLYLYLSAREPNIVSPIQAMKGLFLASKELKLSDFYKFFPYLYGPCSFEVYEDLTRLQYEGLITPVKTAPKLDWTYYKVTPRGAEEALQILQSMDGKTVEKLKEIKEQVLSKGFMQLVKHIYKKYPKYAKNSIIEARRLNDAHTYYRS